MTTQREVRLLSRGDFTVWAILPEEGEDPTGYFVRQDSQPQTLPTLPDALRELDRLTGKTDETKPATGQSEGSTGQRQKIDLATVKPPEKEQWTKADFGDANPNVEKDRIGGFIAKMEKEKMIKKCGKLKDHKGKGQPPSVYKTLKTA